MKVLQKLVQRFGLLAMSSFLLTGCSLPLIPSKSGLQVITTDVPASIYLNGQYLEKAPYIGKSLKPGEYLLKIQPEDSAFVPYETTVSLKKGLLTVVTWKPGNRPETSGGVIYEMEKLPKKNQTEISVISIPDKAIVSLDQSKKDFTPLLLEDVSAGSHEFEVRLPSYDSQKHTINVIDGYRINITVKLAKNTLDESPPSQKSQETTATEKNLTQDEEASTAADDKTKTATEASQTPVRSSNSSQADFSQGTVTIESTNFFQDGAEVLRVRSMPGGSGQELGFATVGKSYPYLGETTNGWLKIEFSKKEGWVSGKYATLEE